VREIVLLAVGMVRPNVPLRRCAVDVKRRGVDERRRDALGDPANAGDVRLLGVVGIRERERPAGLGGEQEDARPWL
jgi:hypothetical protein